MNHTQCPACGMNQIEKITLKNGWWVNIKGGLSIGGLTLLTKEDKEGYFCYECGTEFKKEPFEKYTKE